MIVLDEVDIETGVAQHRFLIRFRKESAMVADSPGLNDLDLWDLECGYLQRSHFLCLCLRVPVVRLDIIGPLPPPSYADHDFHPLLVYLVTGAALIEATLNSIFEASLISCRQIFERSNLWID